MRRFVATMSCLLLLTHAGASVVASSTCWTVGRTPAGGLRRGRRAPVSAARAKGNRCSRSASSSRSAGRPVEHASEAPASSATSSRRSPFTRRLPPYTGKPAWSGVMRARHELRNSRTSARWSGRPTSPG
ncbi:hypothetical protein AB0H12_34880 [Actinosynnema sp. NPDC023794]